MKLCTELQNKNLKKHEKIESHQKKLGLKKLKRNQKQNRENNRKKTETKRMTNRQ